MKDKDIIFTLIDDFSEGFDIYINQESKSVWGIFTDEKRWVFELTKDKTLWYNYNFFNNIFKYLSLDVVENQHYITKWVEYTLQNGVKHTNCLQAFDVHGVEDTLQNGVKHTATWTDSHKFDVEDTLQNGVKEIKLTTSPFTNYVEDTIQNGIKKTKTPGADGDIIGTLDFMSDNNTNNIPQLIDSVIQNGVKETKHGIHFFEDTTENAIKNGVKQTKRSYNGSRKQRTKYVIENGIKRAFDTVILSNDEVDDVIQNGIKQTKKMEHDRTTYHAHFNREHGTHIPMDKVQDVIQNGIKNTEIHKGTRPAAVEDIIQNGVKNTFHEPSQRTWKVGEILQNSIEHTEYGDWLDYDERINDIIKDTKPHFRHVYNPMTFEPVIKEEKRFSDVDEVLETGVKKTKAMDEWVNTENILNKVINNGVKEVQPLPAQDGNRDWGNYYHRQEDVTKPHTEYVNEIINDGIRIIQ